MANSKNSQSQTTRDELLIENAILKYNEKVRSMLKDELKPIYSSFELQNTKIEHIDKRVGSLETEVASIKETVEPFSKFRRQMWYFFIAATLLLAFTNQEVQNLISQWFKK